MNKMKFLQNVQKLGTAMEEIIASAKNTKLGQSLKRSDDAWFRINTDALDVQQQDIIQQDDK